jgi:tRNA(Ile)-lysidine synthase
VRKLDLTSRFEAALGAVPEDFAGGPVGLAVSGGSDSLALLHLAHQWARPRGARLLVLTVDHRLRPAGAAEAAGVARLAGELGLAHRTLAWDAPVARQSAARRARHALLAAELKAAGGHLLLTGHTASDQAETVLMRARQGSGWYGLAGMRALSLSPVWPEGEGVWIARPLLGETREDLRGWLEGQGLGWSDDPSNDNPAFERVRVRTRLAASRVLRDRTLACQQHFAGLRRLEDALLANWLGRHVHIGADGTVIAHLAGLAPERAARGLGILLQCVAGRETPPRSQALLDLAARSLAAPAFRGATLGGVRLRPSRAGLKLAPESGARLNPPSPEALAARMNAFRHLFITSAHDFVAGAGKESFLEGLPPIFAYNTVSIMRDLP